MAQSFYEFRRRAVAETADFARTFPTDQAGCWFRALGVLECRVLGFRGQVASLGLSEGEVRESVEFQTSSGVQGV